MAASPNRLPFDAARPASSDQLLIEFRPDEALVAVRWAGRCEFNRLRDVYARVAALLKRTAARHVLFDTRQREMIGEEAARWVATEGYAELLADRAAPLWLAYVVPPDVLAQFGGGRTENLSEILHIGVFGTPGGALAWLHRPPPKARQPAP